ncbi:MAG: hypothetical protein ABI672_18080 [Vicinamibacteria bacterium]
MRVMKTWMKVAIGCFAVALIGTFMLIAGVVGLGYFAKSKLEEVTGGEAVESARRTANAVPFTRPAGDIIAEPRLVKYIEVRASVYSVYEKYRGEIDNRVAKAKEGKSLDFSDISTGLTFLGEIHKAESLALAKHEMSENEYEFITGEVYKTLWFDLTPGMNGGKAMEEAGKATAQAADAMKNIDTSTLPPEAREALKQAGVNIAESQKEAAKELSKVKSAPENEALFKKYETDLRKYAMPGMNILIDNAAKDGATPSPETK